MPTPCDANIYSTCKAKIRILSLICTCSPTAISDVIAQGNYSHWKKNPAVSQANICNVKERFCRKWNGFY